MAANHAATSPGPRRKLILSGPARPLRPGPQRGFTGAVFDRFTSVFDSFTSVATSVRYGKIAALELNRHCR